ncbi:MAG: epoxyqueuosine reductase QueH [Lachnospiraceae bacterium]|nr:epoxyqueuosine reductase QueH [Lachnospiraceae bacterium]
MAEKPKLLLHSCCAPCSSYVLEQLAQDYQITIFFYNPNLTDKIEYELRRDEQKRLLSLLGFGNQGDSDMFSKVFIEGDYDPGYFYEMASGLEAEPEGSERCFRCYELRLKETARIADQHGDGFFATTLTLSPHKNAARINEIGKQVQKTIAKASMGGANQSGMTSSPIYLSSDFKKKGGYQRSLELSKQYGLYRQNYCGCEFSRDFGNRQSIGNDCR